MTDRYAVLGNPIGHSKSPRIHALFAAQTGQDMDYEALLAPIDGFAATVAEFVAAGGRGANVTVPFKEEAFRLASRRSLRAEAAGAVNTLSFSNSEIVGDNTDGAGLVQDLKANLGCELAGKRILLLGAGGAARGAILPLLEEKPARFVIANRTAGKATGLAGEFTGEAAKRGLIPPQGGGFDDLAGESFDLVINATSTGLSNTALSLPATVFAPGALAYDMVYGRETPFMAQARSTGCSVADGLGMLVEQAAEAFFLWRGLRPHTAPVMAALRAS